MAASETLVEVNLVFTRDRAWSVEAHADGFELRAWEGGESGQFRHWPLVRGWIGTTADNEIREIGVRECAPGTVRVPGESRPLPGEVEARLGWPAEVAGRLERRDDELSYEMRMAEEEPESWFAIGDDVWLGLSHDRALSRIVARARAPVRERVELRVPADRYAAALSAGRFLQVEREPSGGRRGLAGQLGGIPARGVLRGGEGQRVPVGRPRRGARQPLGVRRGRGRGGRARPRRAPGGRRRERLAGMAGRCPRILVARWGRSLGVGPMSLRDG